jgi:phosphoglycerol transferase
MNPRFTKDMDRKPINIFINSPIAADKTINRTFTPFDIYPTIVESLGAKIDGHRLGLGTSMFSDVPTLTEGKLSVEDMDINVRKKSKLYDWMLYGKDVHN